MKNDWKPKKRNAKHRNYGVDISVDENGNPIYSPSTLRVRTGDKVTWCSQAGPFAVAFLQDSPFAEAGLHSQLKSKGVHATISKTIRAGASIHNHYSVAVVDLRKGMDAAVIHLDCGCPEIVVSNDGN
jgi:plastocyanin